MDESHGNLRAAVVRGFVWVGTGQFIGQLVSWISTVVVIRLLSPSDYGLMAMSASFVWLLTLVSELGIGASIVQARTITREEIRKIYGIVLACGVAFAIVGHVTAPLVAAFYGEPRLTSLIRVMNVSFLLAAFYTVPQSLAIRELNFKLKTQIDLAAQVTSALVMVAMAITGAGVWTLVVGPIVAHALRTLAFAVVGHGPALPLFDVRSIGAFIRYGLTITGDRLAYYAHTVSDTVIVGKVLGDALLGTYSVALTLASLPSEKILPIVTQVTFASYSRIQDEGDRIRRNVLRTIQAVSLVAFPVFFLMAAVAPEAIRLVLGDKWSAVIVPFQILCLVMPLRSIAPVLPPAVFAIGQPMVNLVNMILTFIAMAGAFLVGVRYGIAGIALAWVAVYPFVFAVATWRSARVLGLALADVLRQMAFPLPASAALLVILLSVKAGLGAAVGVGGLAALAAAAAGVYIGLFLVFRKDEYLRLRAAFFER